MGWTFNYPVSLVYKIDNKMQALIQNNYRAKIQKEFIWLITMLLMIVGLPLLKNIIVVILEKLYELFIQRAIEKWNRFTGL